MNEKIDIWLVGNTGLRNPNRIQEGFPYLQILPLLENCTGKKMRLAS